MQLDVTRGELETIAVALQERSIKQSSMGQTAGHEKTEALHVKIRALLASLPSEALPNQQR